MIHEAKIKGVSYRISVTQVADHWVAKVDDCPGAPEVTGMNAWSALKLCEVKLEKYIKAASRSGHQLRVDKMMRLIGRLRGKDEDGQRVPQGVLREMSVEGRRLRASLILEEALETIEALGFEVSVNVPDHRFSVRNITLAEVGPFDLVGTVDGCYDLRVVTTGTLSSFGVSDEPGQELVDENNLMKFGPGATVREDGKLIKPVGHKPPDLAGWLGSLERESLDHDS